MLRIEGPTKQSGHTRVTGYAHPRMRRALQPIRSLRQLNAFANAMIRRARALASSIIFMNPPDGININSPAIVKVNGCGAHEAA
jgi:hypothetical protein